MSIDLERAVAELRARADCVVLPPGPDLRRRGDRRRRVLALAGAVAVVILVTFSTIGTTVLLGGGRAAGPAAPGVTSTVPKPSVATSPSAPASGEPGHPSQGSPIPVPPGCLGDYNYVDNSWPPHSGEPLSPSVMLEAADWGRCYVTTGDLGGYETYDQPGSAPPRPDVCRDAAPYDSDAHRIAGRFRAFAGEPEIAGIETVTRYASGRAAAFVAEIRTRVAECAVHTNQPEPGLVWGSRVVESGFAGDDSVLVYVGTSATEQGHPGVFVAVVRVGDTVAVVQPYFDLGGDHAYTVLMAQKAAQRLTG